MAEEATLGATETGPDQFAGPADNTVPAGVVSGKREEVPATAVTPVELEQITAFCEFVSCCRSYGCRLVVDVFADLFADVDSIKHSAKGPDPADVSQLRDSPAVLQAACCTGLQQEVVGNVHWWRAETRNCLLTYRGNHVPLVPEIADFFATDIALQASNVVRDWRKLSARLGGTWRGWSVDQLQGIVPVLAVKMQPRIKVEGLALNIWSQYFGALAVEMFGGIDTTDAAGARVFEVWANAVVGPNVGFADILNAGYVPAGAAVPISPLAPAPAGGAPVGSGAEPPIIQWIVSGGPPPANYPPGYLIQGNGPIDSQLYCAIDDRFQVLEAADISRIALAFGSECVVSGLPEQGAGRAPGARELYIRRGQLQFIQMVYIAGRPLPAGIGPPATMPTSREWLTTIGKLIRLWPADSQWSQAFMEAFGHFIRGTTQPSAAGALGGMSPGSNAGRAANALGGPGLPAGIAGGPGAFLTRELTTEAMLFGGCHFQPRGRIEEAVESLGSIDPIQVLALGEREFRRAQTTFQAVFREHFTCGDLDPQLQGSFVHLRRAYANGIQRQGAPGSKPGPLLGLYEGVTTSLAFELGLMLLRQQNKVANFAVFMALSDVWDLQYLNSMGCQYRPFDWCQIDCPMYFCDELCMVGVAGGSAESKKLISVYELPDFGTVVAAAKGALWREGMPVYLGTAPDLPEGSNVRLSAAKEVSRGYELSRRIYGYGSIVWGAEVQQGILPAQRVFTVDRTPLAIADGRTLGPSTQMQVGFIGGFLRVGSIPMYMGTIAQKAAFRIADGQAAAATVRLNANVVLGGASTTPVPLQFKGGVSLEFAPAAGLSQDPFADIFG